MKKISILLLCATVCMISCDKDSPVPVPEPSQGEQATISVAMSADDSGIKLSWQAGDQITVSRGGENQPFTLKDGEGTTSGTFNGIVPGGIGDYTVTYGSGDMKGQAQSADASTAHLKKHIRLEAVAASLLGKIDLKMTGCIMTFSLSGLPADVGTLQQLTWAVEGDAKTNFLPLDLTGCTLSNGALTAYLAFAPTEMSIEKGGKLTVTLFGSQKVCKAVMTLANGMSYTAGKQYTTTVDGTNTPWQVMTPPMAFTVKVDEITGLDFNIPFSGGGGTTTAEITVDWGDGSAPAVVASGTELTGSDGFNHTYASAGTYQISITSSQMDDTKQQMPRFNFSNRSSNENNNKKLISMDTPMLNTGRADFFKGFSGCTSLASIPVGLFDKNTQVDNFGSCFQGCTSLASIPVGLFDTNTKATTFVGCFRGCTSLASIPVGLFDTNTKATFFEGCFRGCTSLASIPVGLFDKNTQVDNFESCFQGCTSLTSIPTGLFDKNTQETSFSRCFEGCTSLASIPEGLFDKNRKVKNFFSCFKDCTSLVLNPKIFSINEDKATRFSGKKMNFSFCFQNAGYALTDVSKSIAPDLWNYNTEGAAWATGNCYWYCKASNTAFADIPRAWGGTK